METTLDRIKKYIDSKNISNSAFEKMVGFSNGSFASQLKKGKTIGVDKLENILNVFPELSPKWLLTGSGEMIRSDNFSGSNSQSVPAVMNKQVLRKVYDSENWQLAQLLKEEVQTKIRTSTEEEIRALKAFRDLAAKILKFINTVDWALDEQIEQHIFEDLNSGKNIGDIRNEIDSDLNIIKKLCPHLVKLNKHLQESIHEFKPFDNNSELESSGEDELNRHLLNQEYEIVSRLKDKLKIYRRYSV